MNNMCFRWTQLFCLKYLKRMISMRAFHWQTRLRIAVYERTFIWNNAPLIWIAFTFINKMNIIHMRLSYEQSDHSAHSMELFGTRPSHRDNVWEESVVSVSVVVTASKEMLWWSAELTADICLLCRSIGHSNILATGNLSSAVAA